MLAVKNFFETPWWQLLMQDAGDRRWCWTDGLFHIHVQVLLLAHGASGTLAGELWHIYSLAVAENSIANQTVTQSDTEITQDGRLSEI